MHERPHNTDQRGAEVRLQPEARGVAPCWAAQRSAVAAFAAQRRQADAGRLEAAVDAQHLSGDVAGTVAAQKEDRFGEFFFKPVTVEGNGVVIVGADRRRMNRLRHGCVHRARCNSIDPNAKAAEFDGELLGQMGKARIAGAVGGAQRGGAKRGDRGDVYDRTTSGLAHQRRRGLGAEKRSGQIHCEHAVPIGLRRLEQRLEDRNAGIIDQRIKPSEMRNRLREGCIDRNGIGDVAMNCRMNSMMGTMGSLRWKRVPRS